MAPLATSMATSMATDMQPPEAAGLVTTGLVLRLEPDTITDGGDGSIESWASSVGSDDFIQATASAKPDHGGTPIFGVDAVSCESGDSLTETALSTAVADALNSTSYTVYYVCAADSAAMSSVIPFEFNDGTSGNRMRAFLTFTAGEIVFSIHQTGPGGNQVVNTFNGTAPELRGQLGQVMYGALVRDGANYQMYALGYTLAPVALVRAPVGISQGKIGGGTNPVQDALLAVYDRALTEAEVQQNDAYVRASYLGSYEATSGYMVIVVGQSNGVNLEGPDVWTFNGFDFATVPVLNVARVSQSLTNLSPGAGNNMWERTEECLRLSGGRRVYMVFDQGEAGADSDEISAAWQGQCEAYIDACVAVCNEVGAVSFNLIFDYFPASWPFTYTSRIRAAQEAIVAARSYCSGINNDDLTADGTGFHHDAASILIKRQRIEAEVLALESINVRVFVEGSQAALFRAPDDSNAVLADTDTTVQTLVDLIPQAMKSAPEPAYSFDALSASQRPGVAANGGLGFVYATDTRMRSLDATLAAAIGSGDATVYVVATLDSAVSFPTPINLGTGSGLLAIFRSGTNMSTRFQNNGQDVSASPLNVGDTFLYAARRIGNVASAFIRGVKGTDITLTGANPTLAGLSEIGNWQTFTRGWDGPIYEIFVCRAGHDDATIAAVSAQLQTYWATRGVTFT